MIEVVWELEVASKQRERGIWVRARQHACLDPQVLLFASSTTELVIERLLDGCVPPRVAKPIRHGVPHNAAVQRPRAALSSATHVHNEMAHVRRARADL